jgi:hypothetical protein
VYSNLYFTAHCFSFSNVLQYHYSTVQCAVSFKILKVLLSFCTRRAIDLLRGGRQIKMFLFYY